jgi:hypothetical protein
MVLRRPRNPAVVGAASRPVWAWRGAMRAALAGLRAQPTASPRRRRAADPLRRPGRRGRASGRGPRSGRPGGHDAPQTRNDHPVEERRSAIRFPRAQRREDSGAPDGRPCARRARGNSAISWSSAPWSTLPSGAVPRGVRAPARSACAPGSRPDHDHVAREKIQRLVATLPSETRLQRLRVLLIDDVEAACRGWPGCGPAAPRLQ